MGEGERAWGFASSPRGRLGGFRTAALAFCLILLLLALSEAALGANDVPAPTVTLPDSAGPFAQGAHGPGGLDGGRPATSGYFHVYAYKNGTYYYLDSQAATGAELLHLRLDRHPAHRHRLRRPGVVRGRVGQLALLRRLRPGLRDHRPTLPAPTVTLPDTAGPFAQGEQVPVAWTVASPPRAATSTSTPTERHLLLPRSQRPRRQLLHLRLDRHPARRQPATSSGCGTWTDGNWLSTTTRPRPLRSPAATLPAPTVTLPDRPGPSPRASRSRWPGRSRARQSGYFHVYAYKNGTYYYLDSQAATGSSSYTYDWTVTQPTGSGYVIRVWYVDASGNWLAYDDSSPAFEITGRYASRSHRHPA